MTRIYAYCPYAMADAAQRLGWLILGPMPMHHGEYSLLVEWLCDCKPRYWRRGV